MKKTSALAIATGMVVAVSGCGGDDSPSDSSSGGESSAQEVSTIDEGTLTVCADISFRPMEYIEEGSDEPTGFDIEAARLVAEELGLEATFENIGFDGLLPALNAGRCDVVWSTLYVNEERTAQFDAISYYDTGYGVLVPAGNPENIQSTDDFSGLTVAVGAGTDTMQTLEEISAEFEAAGQEPMELALYQKVTEEFAAVRSGKADVAVEVDVALAEAVATEPESFEIVPGVFPTDAKLGIYGTKDSELLPAINEALATLHADGALDELADEFGLTAENLAIEGAN